MKFFYSAFVLVIALWGCGQATPTKDTNVAPVASAGKTTAGELGSKVPAPPYEVTLRGDGGNPKAADAKLAAEVTKDGKPLANAEVRVELVMPEMADMGSTVLKLKSTGLGIYKGHSELPMAGTWDAKVIVKGPGGPEGSAAYRFAAN